MPLKTAGMERREKLRQQFWTDEDAWTGMNENGWFKTPRTLPLILTLLSEKSIRGSKDPVHVYLELWSRHVDGGVIEMVHEGEHAYAAGCTGTRAVRTWQERMEVLEELGFIKTKAIGSQRYKYVFMVHPTTAIQNLRDAGKISDSWWDTYCARQIETKEATFAQRHKNAGKQRGKVVPITRPKTAAKAAGKR